MRYIYTKINLVFIIVLLLFSSSSIAQIEFEKYGSSYVWDHWYGQVAIGGNAFFGDISSHDHDPINKLRYETSYGYSASFGKWANSWIALQVSLSGGKLKGIKDSCSSHTSFYQYTFDGIINVTQLIKKDQKQTSFYGYLKLGYGLINFTAYNTNNENENNDYANEGARITEWVIPMGAGVVYNLDKNFSFFLDATYQYVNTDKLDAKCTSNGILDNYVNGSLGFRYTFNLKSSRHKYRRNSSRKGLHWVK